MARVHGCADLDKSIRRQLSRLRERACHPEFRPINVNGVTRHNYAIYDPNLAAFSVPAITDPCVVPAFNVNGYSHFPIFLADNADFGPPNTRPPGQYVYSVTMTDSTGNGWRISATFVLQ